VLREEDDGAERRVIYWYVFLVDAIVGLMFNIARKKRFSFYVSRVPPFKCKLGFH
jgi:hypothetical protein